MTLPTTGLNLKPWPVRKNARLCVCQHMGGIFQQILLESNEQVQHYVAYGGEQYEASYRQNVPLIPHFLHSFLCLWYICATVNAYLRLPVAPQDIIGIIMHTD